MKLLGSGGFTTPISMIPSEWRKPFNFSIGLHIIAVVLAMLAPTLFDQKPRLPEIYTVNLFTATEVAEISPPPAKTPAAKPVVRQIKPEATKPAVSIQPAKPEVSPAKPAVIKQISLKPRKMKIKVGKTSKEEAADKAKLNQMVERMRSQDAEKQAKAEADHAAKDAVSKLADALKTSSPGPVSGPSAKAASGQTSSDTKTSGVAGPKGTGVEPEFYMKQYLSAVHQKINDHWVLPDLQNWDNALEAVLSITIGRDGTVTESHFERKSSNIYFNQFVLKAVKEASPMPPFPNQLIDNMLEIGLRFKPGELN